MDLSEVRDAINNYARRPQRQRREPVHITFTVSHEYGVFFQKEKPRHTIATWTPFFIDALIEAGGLAVRGAK